VGERFPQSAPRLVRRKAAAELGRRADFRQLDRLLSLRDPDRDDFVRVALTTWPVDSRTRAVSRVWGRADEALKRLLKQQPWRSSAALSLLYLEDPSQLAGYLLARHRPEDPLALSLLLFLSGGLEDYLALDPRQDYLREAFLQASPQGRAMLLARLRSLGRPDLVLRLVPDASFPWHRLDEDEFRVRIQLLRAHKGLEALLGVLPELRLDQAAEALELLREAGALPEELLWLEAPGPDQVRADLERPLWIATGLPCWALSPEGGHRVWWDMEGLHLDVEVVPCDLTALESVAIPVDGGQVACLDPGGTLEVVTVPRGRLLFTHSGVQRVIYSGSRLAFATLDEDHSVIRWADDMGFAGYRFRSRISAWASMGEGALVVGLEDGSVSICLGPWPPRVQGLGHRAPCLQVAAAPWGGVFATACSERVCMWRTSETQARLVQTYERRDLKAMALHRSGQWVAAADGQRTVWVWGEGRPSQRLEMPDDVTALAFSERLLAVGTARGLLRLWDFRGGTHQDARGWSRVESCQFASEDDLWVVRRDRSADRLAVENPLRWRPMKSLTQVPVGISAATQRFLARLLPLVHRYSLELGEGGPGPHDVMLEEG
ncbi:MAG: WD40 repeat domain-containing protein, partial [Candidatus Eremiobacterota bacterium]